MSSAIVTECNHRYTPPSHLVVTKWAWNISNNNNNLAHCYKFCMEDHFHCIWWKLSFCSKSMNFFSIPVLKPDPKSPEFQLQHAGTLPIHILKTEGARIYFWFNNKSQWNLHTSHHFSSKSTSSLPNPNIIAYSEPSRCLLPLTTLSSLQHMKNEAAGIQKCVEFEHTGGRRWPLNSDSAAKS